MLQYVFDKDLDDDEPVAYSAYDQQWDKATLKELKDKHDVIFMTGGDAVLPIKIVKKDGRNSLVTIGSEDDGTITFDREYGYFKNIFSVSWIPSLIKDLEEALYMCNSDKE